MKHAKNWASIAVILSLVFLPSPGSARNTAQKEVFSSGTDWMEKMSVREKLISLLPPSLLMHRYGVPLKKTIDSYVPLIDSVLEDNPQLEKNDMASIFASTVYYYEPESREALKAMERNLNLRNKGYNPTFFPKLMINAPLDKDITD